MKCGYLILPDRDGWCVEITCKNGEKIFKTLLTRDYPTKDDVKKYIKDTCNITKDDCTKYEISECIM